MLGTAGRSVPPASAPRGMRSAERQPFPALLALDQFDLDFDTASLSGPNIMGKEIIRI